MRCWSILLVAALAIGCGDDDTASAQTEGPAWFEGSELLGNLRSEDRRRAGRHIAPRELDELTLHDLEVEVAEDLGSFTATEELYFTNTTGEALSSVVLRIYGNAVGDSPQVRLTGSGCVAARCQIAFDGRSVVEVRPAEPVPVDGRLRIHLELAGTLKEIAPERASLMGQAMEGLTRLGEPGMEHGDYGLLAHGSGVASLGNFYAVIAPRRDGEWVRGDDSTLGDLGSDGIVHFRAKVKAPQGSRIAVTGEVIHEQTTLGQNGQPGHTELLAVAGLTRNFAIVLSRAFEIASAEVQGVQVRSYFLPSDRAAGEAALETAKVALNTFHRRFGPYPYTDLEVVEAPLVGGAGGVEFSGLVTVAQMFYGSAANPMAMLQGLLGQSPTQQGGAQSPLSGMQAAMLDFVVAHEVAHQWWHGLVGSDARTHPFVDESLAQFSAMLYVEDRFGADRAEREGKRQVAANYHFMRMRGIDDAAVDRPVAAFGDSMAYAGLVYGKGPYLYPALREAMGDRAFFEGIRGYVRDHRFGVAEPRALFDRLARGRHRREVRRLERHWLDEAHGDEDLGEADMSSLAGMWFEGAGSPIEGAMQMLQGAGLGGAAGGGAGGGDAQTQQAMQQLLEQLQRMQGAAAP
jgi:hypothetical protein